MFKWHISDIHGQNFPKWVNAYSNVQNKLSQVAVFSTWLNLMHCDGHLENICDENLHQMMVYSPIYHYVVESMFK
jgi:hypothetical protein